MSCSPQIKGSSKQDIWLVTVSKGVSLHRENVSSRISRLYTCFRLSQPRNKGSALLFQWGNQIKNINSKHLNLPSHILLNVAVPAIIIALLRRHSLPFKVFGNGHFKAVEGGSSMPKCETTFLSYCSFSGRNLARQLGFRLLII
jgi:hypothetical protein